MVMAITTAKSTSAAPAYQTTTSWTVPAALANPASARTGKLHSR